MMTFLGTLLGFFASCFPDVLRVYREKADRAHELAILDRQIAAQQMGHTQRLQEIEVQAQSQEMTALYRHARLSGGRLIDGLSASVRPLITYAFFILYASVKIAQMLTLHFLADHWNWSEIIVRIWHEEDQGLFATVMSFWFGQRALSKFYAPRKRI